MRKKKVYVYFVIFQQLEMKKKRGNEKKKNVGAEIGNGLLPELCSDQGARQLGAGRRRARHDAGRVGEGARGTRGAGQG